MITTAGSKYALTLRSKMGIGLHICMTAHIFLVNEIGADGQCTV